MREEILPDGKKLIYLPERHVDFIVIIPSPWVIAYFVFGLVFILFSYFRFLSAI